MDSRRGKEQNPLGSIIAVGIMLLLLSGNMLMILGIVLLVALVAGAIFLIVWLIRRRMHVTGHQKLLKNTTYDSCQRQKAWDEKVQSLFCFHKDKAFHHVRRGKEIDPWDRPDIDISKYQRKQ